MKAVRLLPLLLLAYATAEARPMRTITVEFTKPTLGDTYDLMVGMVGQPLTRVAIGTYSLPTVVVSGFVVGATYNFTSIVRRGNLRSVQPPPCRYTITKASNQKLLGVSK